MWQCHNVRSNVNVKRCDVNFNVKINSIIAGVFLKLIFLCVRSRANLSLLINVHVLAILLLFLLPQNARGQGTINYAILESGIGGSGDPRRKWERGREGEREKCCFCLQNDLKEL